MWKGKINKFKFLIVSIIAFLPAFAMADIRINEIMYDLTGADNGGEWLEIKNDGSGSIDLTYVSQASDKHWKLVVKEESVGGGTAYGIKPYQGGAIVHPGEFAIIAIDPEVFLSAHSGWSGILLDVSASSLKDKGEALSVVAPDGTIFDSFDYTNFANNKVAAGSGNTLSLVSGSWVEAVPTPGVDNAAAETTSQETNQQNSTQIQNSQSESTTTTTSGDSGTNTSPNTASGQASTGSTWKVDPGVYADAGPDRTIMAGVETEFKGGAFGVKKEPLLNAVLKWNFGDGMTGNGKTVSHAYKFPGKYIITLDVSSGEYSQGDEAVVNVIAPAISIGSREEGQNGFIEIKNTGDQKVDISGILLKNNYSQFIFPKGTLIGGKSSVKFANNVTSLLAHVSLGLFYQNGLPILTTTVTNTSTQAPAKQVQAAQNIPSSTLTKVSTDDLAKSSVAGVVTAFPEEANTNKTSSNNLWLYILSVIVIAGFSASVVLLQKKEVPSPAEEYEILE